MENKLVILNNSLQFEECRRSGKKLFVHKKLLLSFRANALDHHRFGWTVPKYIGSAVTRNKLKRYCREFFRNQNLHSKSHFDVNVVFLKSGKDEYKNMRYGDFSKLLYPAWDSLLKKN